MLRRGRRRRAALGLTARLWQRIVSKGLRYWLTALIILILATAGSPYVYQMLRLTDARAHFFQQLIAWGPRPAVPRFVRVVLIEDDEYWQGQLAGRRPIKRDYLAQLIHFLDAEVKPRVIALDFYLRLPDPHAMAIPDDYRAETAQLIEAIEKAARNGRRIVLATPISFDADGDYQRDPDPYRAYGLCGPRDPQNTWKDNVTCGYIALPYDPLVIPGELRLADGSPLDSFALAIAKATKPDIAEKLLGQIGTNVRYGNFIPAATFIEFRARTSISKLRTDPAAREPLEGHAVIVGAHWSRDAAGRGPRVDLHWTPVGSVVGAELHANFAEALLDSRVFRATPPWALHSIEITLSIVAALVFGLVHGLLAKLVCILWALVGLFLAQWAALHGFGVFFDIFVPLVGLGLHSLYERLFAPAEHAARHLARS